MALVLQDRVRETSSTTGTGAISLGGAYVGYRTFGSCVPHGSVVYYCIQNTTAGYETEWEVGYGTYTGASPSYSNELVRVAEQVYSSSSGPATLVNFSSPAELQVFITQPAEQAVYQETDGRLKLIGGIIEVSLDNTESSTPLPNVAFQAFSTINSYMQSNMQNLSSDPYASADYVCTADEPAGTDTDNYIDLGFANSGYEYPEYSGTPALSGYIQCTGDVGLVLQAGKYGANVAGANASATDIIFSAGDLLTSGYRGRIKGNTGNWILSNNSAPTDNGQKFQVDGNATVSGVTTFGSYVYSAANVATAANSTVLTTKAYVDASASTAFVVHPSVVYATAAVLPNSPNYNNGTVGVGANLVATTNGALVVDGVELTDPTDVGIRILVKSQANAAHNGCYTVTAVGGPSATWELTRSTDFDVAGAGEIANNAYFYVTAGDTLIGSSWILSQLNAITVGTTDLPFSLFASPIGYTVNYPLELEGTSLSLSGVVDVAHGGTNVAAYTTGDILYASNASTLTKLAAGNSNAPLTVVAGVPSWSPLALGSANAVSGTLLATNGGTGINTYTTGDLIYSSAANTLSKLAGQTTTTKKYLSQTGDGVNSAAPAWAQVAAADISGLAPSATTDTTNATNITSGTLATGRMSGSYTGITGVGNLTAGTWSANVVGTTYGGTGAAGTITGLVYGNGASAMSAASAAEVVAVIGSTAVANATYAVSSNSSTYTSNILGGLAGGIPYQTGANTTAILAAGTGVLVAGATPEYSTTPTLTGTNFSGIPNSATTAASANGASTIVARDINGSFGSNVVTATLFSGSGASLTSIPNSATTAASANGASTIVARDVNGSFAANVITATLSGAASSLSASNWTVSQSGTTLYFAYNGTNKMSLDSSGNLVVVGNVTAYGTI